MLGGNPVLHSSSAIHYLSPCPRLCQLPLVSRALGALCWGGWFGARHRCVIAIGIIISQEG